MASGAPSLPDPRKADEEEAKVEIPLDDDGETGANENTGRFAQHGTGQQPGAGAGKPPGPSVQPTYAAPPTPSGPYVTAQPVMPTAVVSQGQVLPEDAIPVYYLGPNEERLLTTAALARGIKILAVLDGVILLINMISFGGMLHPWGPLIVLMSWGPLSGYFSASHYNACLATVYLAYYSLRIATDVVALYYRLWWFLISLLADLFIARYVFTFMALLRMASAEEVEVLRNPEQARAALARRRPYFVVF